VRLRHRRRSHTIQNVEDAIHYRHVVVFSYSSILVSELRLLSVYTRFRPIRRVVVADWSMSPTLLPDDRLLVASWLQPRVGDLVVAQDPEAPARLLVKRVAAIGPTGIELRVEPGAFGRDSRRFGPVAPSAVVGRVIWRYGPRARRGRV
jgi:hypothetical protein